MNVEALMVIILKETGCLLDRTRIGEGRGR